jgi:sulfite dehydrogenase (quinone) subunit SoeC
MERSKPWEFMVKYTPQREWSEGMGALMSVAFFFGGISGGLYLVSLYADNLWGMFIGWICAMLMGMADMVHLSKPWRAWRIAFRPKSSWISRGFLFIILFIGCAGIQLAISKWYPGTTVETVFKVFAGILAFGVAIYQGFVVSYVNAIRLWNSAMMPVLFITSGLVGGVAILLAINVALDTTKIQVLQDITLVALIAYAVVLTLHLWISTYSSTAAKDSVMRILTGNLAALFWLAVIAVGIALPLIIFLAVSTDATALLFLGVAFVALGNLGLRYTILKAGMYSPLVSSPGSE